MTIDRSVDDATSECRVPPVCRTRGGTSVLTQLPRREIEEAVRSRWDGPGRNHLGVGIGMA